MTRTSAAHAKGYTRGAPPLKARPDLGTAIGEIYDLFRRRPAHPIPSRPLYAMAGGKGLASVLERLRDYGLDIRHHSRGYYWLVGEDTQFGYVDHIAAKAEEFV